MIPNSARMNLGTAFESVAGVSIGGLGINAVRSSRLRGAFVELTLTVCTRSTDRVRNFNLVHGFVLLCLSFAAAADEWAAPTPVGFNSRGFSYVAEIFPPHSRQNSTGKPVCFFYEVGYGGGTEWKIDAKLKWKAPLVNDLMPYQAVVSMHGRLVTLNEYGALGYKNAVAIYSQTGTLVKTYQLDEFLPANDVGKIQPSVSSRWWNKDAKYYFLDNPGRIYLVLPWGKVAEFYLDTGRHKYGPTAEFSDLAKAMAKSINSSEETEIWATSLRFSSITDIMEAKEKHGER